MDSYEIDYEQILFDLILIILANVNDAEQESLDDLIKSLKLLKFSAGKTAYLSKLFY